MFCPPLVCNMAGWRLNKKQTQLQRKRKMVFRSSVRNCTPFDFGISQFFQPDTLPCETTATSFLPIWWCHAIDTLWKNAVLMRSEMPIDGGESILAQECTQLRRKCRPFLVWTYLPFWMTFRSTLSLWRPHWQRIASLWQRNLKRCKCYAINSWAV